MSTLENAISLIRQGRKAEAQPMLQALIKSDPRNIQAWFWYVETCSALEKRVQALEMCLKMNPGNPQVTQALQRFQAQLPAMPIQPESPKPVTPSPAFSHYEEKTTPPPDDDRFDYGAFRSSFEPEEKTPASYQNDYGYGYAFEEEAAQPASRQKQPWEMEPAEYVDNSMLSRSKSRKPVHTYGALDVWATALTVQDVKAYEDFLDDPKAGIGRAFTWVAIAGLVSALTLPFVILINPQFADAASMPELQTAGASSFLVILTIIAVFVVPISSIINLAISGGFQHFLAMFFGGTGNYTRTVYALAAFITPISILTSLIAIVPYLGPCLITLIGLYSVVLNVRALRAAHSLSVGAALGVLFAPSILVFIFACVLFFLAGGTGLIPS